MPRLARFAAAIFGVLFATVAIKTALQSRLRRR